MTKDNHFQQYGYDHYLKSPKRPRDDDRAEGSGRRLRAGPGVMTLALLLTGAVFATVIVTSYPSGESKRGEIPIVKADLRPVKTRPDEPGGMDIPNRESTILARVGEAPIQADRRVVENLLESPDEAMMSREEAIEAAMAGAEYSAPDEGLAPIAEVRGVQPADVLQKIEEPAAGSGAETTALHEAGTSPETKDFVRNALSQAKSGVEEVEKPSLAIKQAEIKTSDAMKTEASKAQDAVRPDQSALAAPVAPVASDVTLDDVQESNLAALSASAVTGETQYQQEAADAISAIEPAAGMVSPAPKINNATSGGYYVQLASVPSRNGTESEWAKLQKKFGSLIGGMKYRVQEASLGARGTFYRIQAGPISKDGADQICREVKAVAPGGCLVVKK